MRYILSIQTVFFKGKYSQQNMPNSTQRHIENKVLKRLDNM